MKRTTLNPQKRQKIKKIKEKILVLYMNISQNGLILITEMRYVYVHSWMKMGIIVENLIEMWVVQLAIFFVILKHTKSILKIKRYIASLFILLFNIFNINYIKFILGTNTKYSITSSKYSKTA